MQKIRRNDPCWCGSGKKYKDCHMELEEKLTQFRRQGAIVPTLSLIHIFPLSKACWYQ